MGAGYGEQKLQSLERVWQQATHPALFPTAHCCPPEQEGQQQRPDVGAVHVSICQQHNLAVPAGVRDTQISAQSKVRR